MANTTWKQVVYDVADGIRTLLGTTGTIPVGELKNKLTGITRKSAATYTPSTSAQTIKAGQYLAGDQTISAMPSGALSDISISSSGLITGQVSTSGYLSSGTKKTKQLTTKGATTITPGTTAQTAVASGVYTTGAVTVSAVPTETKTVTPTSSSQTVTPSSGKFLSGITLNAADMSSVNVTNGTTEEYYAYSEDISSGTFVELSYSGSDSASLVSSVKITPEGLVESGGPVRFMKTINLSDNIVAVFTPEFTHSNMYINIYSVDSNSITTLLSNYKLTGFTSYYAGAYCFDVIKLSDTKLFLCGDFYDGNSGIKSEFIDINSDYTITETVTGITTSALDPYNCCLYKLTDSKLLLLFSTGDNYYYLNSVIYSINTNNNIASTGTSVQLSTTKYSFGSCAMPLKLSDTSAVFLHGYNSSWTNPGQIYTLVLSISGTTITLVSDIIELKETSSGYNFAYQTTWQNNAIQLNNGIFYLPVIDNYNEVFGSLIIKLNDSNTVSIVRDFISFGIAPYTFNSMYPIKINNNKVLLLLGYNSSSSGYPSAYGSVGDIINGTCTTQIQLMTMYGGYQVVGSLVPTKNSALFIGTSTPTNTRYTHLIGLLNYSISTEKITESTDKIYGITKTAATTTTPGQVWVLA